MLYDQLLILEDVFKSLLRILIQGFAKNKLLSLLPVGALQITKENILEKHKDKTDS